jgi:hypothetical protein
MADPAAPSQPADDASEIALYCPSCMYDLRGLSGEQCPECGTKLDRELLAKSSIPWVHREGWGTRAFLRTAWLATFKTEFFCLEVARPVSLTDARKFRRRVVAWLTVVALFMAAGILSTIEDTRDPMERLWRTRPILMVLGALFSVLTAWLFMLAITGVHMYWFHPKSLSVEQQNRAVVISHYGCAPLLGLVPAVLTFGFGNMFGISGEQTDNEPMIWIAIGLVLVGGVGIVFSLVAYLFVCAHMARNAAHRSGPARLTLWLGLPSLWLGLIALIFGVLPLAGFSLYILVTSL